MDCVFVAFAHHLNYMGLHASRRDFAYYKWFKRATGDAHSFTYGGLVPSLIHTLARMHDLDVVIQSSFLDKAFYVANACQHERNLLKQWIVKRTDFGENVPIITLEPAIYLPMPTMPHAFFTEVVPDVALTMALQLKRRQ
jgi:hypothetical protein